MFASLRTYRMEKKNLQFEETFLGALDFKHNLEQMIQTTKKKNKNKETFTSNCSGRRGSTIKT